MEEEEEEEGWKEGRVFIDYYPDDIIDDETGSSPDCLAIEKRAEERGRLRRLFRINGAIVRMHPGQIEGRRVERGRGGGGGGGGGRVGRQKQKESVNKSSLQMVLTSPNKVTNGDGGRGEGHRGGANALP